MKDSHKLHRLQLAIFIMMILLLLVSLCWTPIDQFFLGYQRIMTSSSILITDYLMIGGMAATLFNVLTTTGLNILLLKWMKAPINGGVLACLLTIAGFAFFGKNLYNALPIYLGVWLYAKATKTPLKQHVLVFLLSSGISPLTSYLIFGAGLPLGWGIVSGTLSGVFIGFILPAFNAFSMKFHQGYNLYNTGFSMGVISMIATALMASFGMVVERNLILSTDFHQVLSLLTIGFSLCLIMLAFWWDGKVLTHYPKIFRQSGKLLSDFIHDVGLDVTLLNMGIMGLLTMGMVWFLGIQISGPVMGAILTILGFSAFGKHPFNSLPVILGAVLAIELTPIEWTTGNVLAVLFVTGLAPVAGQFGLIAGVFVGFIHVMITPLALEFQGGFDLYNNGFAAGFVAALFVPILSQILKKRDESKRWYFFLPLKRNEEISS
ncbi:MAG: DUF1576 domain-containing protein [Candidatus Izemoplasmatales bacterium]